MASKCIYSCVNDAIVPPVRANYANLYKWPESDAEFVKRLISNVPTNGQRGTSTATSPPVVDSISCRQMYLRSYPFSREKTMPEKNQTYFGRDKKKMEVSVGGYGRGSRRNRNSNVRGGKKKKSLAAFCSIFHRLLSCSSSVDVVNH